MVAQEHSMGSRVPGEVSAPQDGTVHTHRGLSRSRGETNDRNTFRESAGGRDG